MLKDILFLTKEICNEVLLKEFFKSHCDFFIEYIENGVYKVGSAVSKRVNTY